MLVKSAMVVLTVLHVLVILALSQPLPFLSTVNSSTTPMVLTALAAMALSKELKSVKMVVLAAPTVLVMLGLCPWIPSLLIA
jgi:hypothetical protein